MSFVIATAIGLLVGGLGAYALLPRWRAALWLTPALSVAGALAGAAVATAAGQPGYGVNEFMLQVVLALAGVGLVTLAAMKLRPVAG